MLKRVRPKAILPQQVTSQEAIKAGFQEILVDINQFADQWNETLYPLIDSLPSGRRQVTAASRTTGINPIDNGFDGSQVFMDLTSSPQVHSGILYNSRQKRPKTIKEVVLDNYSTLADELRKLRIVMNDISLANTEYDDTDLRNWIRRLAGDTVSNDDLGDPFGTGYFGDPTKTVAYSLNQRENNLRTLI